MEPDGWCYPHCKWLLGDKISSEWLLFLLEESLSSANECKVISKPPLVSSHHEICML